MRETDPQFAPVRACSRHAYATAATREVRQASAISLSLVTSREAFAGLEKEWNALFNRAGRASQLFQTHAWNRHWCNHFLIRRGRAAKTASRLSVLCGRAGGRLVMVWPLVTRRRHGYVALEWMGDPVSQYGDVLIESNANTDAWLEAGLRFLIDEVRPDVVWLNKVRADSAVSRLLRRAARVKIIETQHAPIVDLRSISSLRSYQERFSVRCRKRRCRLRTRLLEQEGFKLRVLRGGREAASVSRRALALKRRWLAARGIISRAFLDDRIEAFINDVVSNGEPQCAPLVTAFDMNEEAIAAEIGFMCKGTYVSHMAAYSLKHRKFSPGVLQFENTLQACIERNIDRVDLLAPSDPYKLEWADQQIAVEGFVMPVSVKGRLVTSLLRPGLPDRMRRLLAGVPRPLHRVLTKVAKAAVGG